MDVRSCRQCKRLFNYVVGPFICPVCREELEKKFLEVKKYISDNPNCRMDEVTEACDVDEKQVTTWIREERLQFANAMAAGFGCERCGTGIRSGRFCDKCKVEMTRTFTDAIYRPDKNADKPKNDSREARMRFMDNR